MFVILANIVACNSKKNTTATTRYTTVYTTRTTQTTKATSGTTVTTAKTKPTTVITKPTTKVTTAATKPTTVTTVTTATTKPATATTATTATTKPTTATTVTTVTTKPTTATTATTATTKPTAVTTVTTATTKPVQTTQTTKPVQTTQTTQKPQVPDTDKTVYEVLNDLSKQNYSKIELNITTLTGDIKLGAEYILTKNKVSYAVEQLNMLPTDGKLDGLSPEYKTTLRGTAVIENGKVTKFDGDKVSIPEYDELTGAFDFKESYFKKVEATDGEFSADVVSASKFLGTSKKVSDLKVEVKYNTAAIEKITLTYKTANSNVTTVYEFEK